MAEIPALENDMTKSQNNQEREGYRRTSPLQEQSSLILPRSASWNGIGIEHYQQPPAECELCMPQYTFCVLLNECHIERRVNNGHLHSNRAASGDVIIYPASSHHWVRWRRETEFLLLFLDVAFVTRMAKELATIDTIEVMEYEQEFRDPLVQQIGLALKAELDGESAVSSSLYAESLATALSAHLLRHHTVQQPVIREWSGNIPNTTLQRVLEYIHDNLDHTLTLAELASIADISSYHLAHIFKQTFGIAPHQYILRTRIERAKALLLQGQLSIAEIAIRVGFFDQSHFTRTFKRTVGMTPQALIQQNSKNIP